MGISCPKIFGFSQNVHEAVEATDQKSFELKITDLINFLQEIVDFHQ